MIEKKISSKKKLFKIMYSSTKIYSPEQVYSYITAKVDLESADNIYSICFFTCKARWSDLAKVLSHILHA